MMAKLFIGAVRDAIPGTTPTLIVGAGTATSGANALSVPPPSGYAEGDLLMLVSVNQEGAPTTPSGWTSLLSTTSGKLYVDIFTKVAAASEGNATVSDVGTLNAAIMVALRPQSGYEIALDRCWDGGLSYGGGSTNVTAASFVGSSNYITTGINRLFLGFIMSARTTGTTSVSRTHSTDGSSLSSVSQALNASITGSGVIEGMGIAAVTGEAAASGTVLNSLPTGTVPASDLYRYQICVYSNPK